jgi:predicted metal-binding protein
MKKKAPKLSLSRETIVQLSNSRLERAAGAVPETQDKSCLLSCRAGCSAVGCTDTCPPSIVHTGCFC